MSRLPSGFSWADQIQEKQYAAKGIVHGASKVILVGEDLAVRLHPPKTANPLLRRPLIANEAKAKGFCATQTLEWYIKEYNRGWAAGRSSGVNREWDSGMSSHSFDDGYLDAAAGRPKWHLTHCADHDVCGEG